MLDHIKTNDQHLLTPVDVIIDNLFNYVPLPAINLIGEALIGSNDYTRDYLIVFVVIVAMIERFCLSMMFFFLLCVAERTYKEVLLFAYLRQLIQL